MKKKHGHSDRGLFIGRRISRMHLGRIHGFWAISRAITALERLTTGTCSTPLMNANLRERTHHIIHAFTCIIFYIATIVHVTVEPVKKGRQHTDRTTSQHPNTHRERAFPQTYKFIFHLSDSDSLNQYNILVNIRIMGNARSRPWLRPSS